MAGDNEDFRLQLELEERERVMKQNEGYDANTYTDADGTQYEWDHSKQAWFPKIDDDFIAAYQANYGYGEPTPTTEAPSNKPSDSSSSKDQTAASSSGSQEPEQDFKNLPRWQQKALKRKAAADSQATGWFDVDQEHNTNVYVSGLPTDITEEEFVQLMSKCGIIMKDPETQEMKIKLYRDANGQIKGDGRCCYIKVESVHLALSILDGSSLRGTTVKVERATFSMKGQYDPSKKPRKKKNDKKKLKKIQEKLFDWRPDKPEGGRSRFDKTVIIKNMFDPKEFEEDASLILEYTSDLREECSRFGTVKKVHIYDRNHEGVASVSFTEPEEADSCIAALNGRWFSKRQLSAEHFDGKSKYHIEETEGEKQKRLKQWGEFLESEKKSGEEAASQQGEKDASAASQRGEKDASADPQRGEKDASAEPQQGEKDASAASQQGEKDASAASQQGEKDASAASQQGEKDATAASEQGEKEENEERTQNAIEQS